MPETKDVAEFWRQCRQEVADLPLSPPESWAFGATPQHADALLELVLADIKTGTASSLWDYETDDEPLPTAGELSIILDGRGQPRAVIETVDVRTVPFHEVTAEHAHAEGEGDRSLAHWRHVHERFWREHSHSPHGFAADMPVVCERFRLVWRN